MADASEIVAVESAAASETVSKEGTENPNTTAEVTGAPVAEGATAASGESSKKPQYPLRVQYCKTCTLPAEVHEYLSRSQFEKCTPWLRSHAPEFFPDLFPEECAAKLEALKLIEEQGVELEEEEEIDEVKVAVPIEQKTSGGKKKKAPAEIVLMLGQRKGKKQVTIVYGLDLFGIKLKDATKAAKRKFATGSSVTTSADSRDVIEIQGARQEDFGLLAHKEFGVPKEAIFLINAQKKKVRVFPREN